MRKWRGNEEMEREGGNGEIMRKWKRNGERMRKWRDVRSLHSLVFSICHILSQNIRYGTFVVYVTNNLTYAL